MELIPAKRPKYVGEDHTNLEGNSSSRYGSQNVKDQKKNDVEQFCRRKLEDNERYELLVNAWVPEASFVFPATEINKKNLRFQLSWLQQFPWLTYSAATDSAFCRICIAFSNEEVGKGNHEKVKSLVTNGLKDWKKALEKFREHQVKKFHTDASVDAQSFQLIYEKKKTDIGSDIDESRKRLLLENRQKLGAIIRAVLFCCRQALALRGRRYDGPLSMAMPDENDGNFRALLRFAVESGDLTLKKHLETAGVNASYLSYKPQNEIIAAGDEIITQEIVRRVNESKCFSVTADETTDVSGTEQCTIGGRYVQSTMKKHVLREDFLCFVPVVDLTSAGLANTLLTTLRKLGVKIEYMKGQGYDGARAMSGEFKGCAAIVRKSGLNAPYLYCANHNLNLAICHACDIPPIRNCLGTVKKILNFFRKSNRAGNPLKEHILASKPDAKQTRLLKFCETRWVEHLTSLNLFHDCLTFIDSALEEMDMLKVRSEDVQPNELLASIRTPQFIISLTVMQPIFCLTKSLTVNLQKEECDLSRCVQYANDIHEEIKIMRSKADEVSGEMFKSATHIANLIGTAFAVPRRAVRQTNRDNYDGNPEDYYRRSIFIPFLDKYSAELESRFLEHRELLSKIQNIIPAMCAGMKDEELDKTIQILEKEWPNEVTDSTVEFKSELKMWRRFCSNVSAENRPKTFVEALNVCDIQFYRQIHSFLTIGATLPVTVASSERSFSTLRRVKTYLRNKTGEERLNGLAMLNIHRDIEVTHDQILDILARKRSRIDITL